MVLLNDIYQDGYSQGRKDQLAEDVVKVDRRESYDWALIYEYSKIMNNCLFDNDKESMCSCIMNIKEITGNDDIVGTRYDAG